MTTHEPTSHILTSLAPGYLVASPSLQDPSFEKTLVLLAEHNEDGALGFIVNRGTGISLGALLHGIDDALQEAVDGTPVAEKEVLWGGPVQPNMVWLLFDRDAPEAAQNDALPVGEHLAVGATVELLTELLEAAPTPPFQIILGYAGWGSEQLEDETIEGAWLPLDSNDALIFETPLESRWSEALRALGLSPGGFFMGGPGGKA